MSENWPSQWFDLPLAVFDLETTGKDTGTCKIIEVGISMFYHGELVQQLDWFVDPECEIPKEVVELTHIQQSDVDGQPKLREIAPDILNAFKGHGPGLCGLLLQPDQHLQHDLPDPGPLHGPDGLRDHARLRPAAHVLHERLPLPEEG